MERGIDVRARKEAKMEARERRERERKERIELRMFVRASYI